MQTAHTHRTNDNISSHELLTIHDVQSLIINCKFHFFFPSLSIIWQKRRSAQANTYGPIKRKENLLHKIGQ